MSKSSTIIADGPNPAPGDIFMEEFLKPMGLGQTTLAQAIGAPPRRINEIMLGTRSVIAAADLRLARCFDLSEGHFLRLQADHDPMAKKREFAGALQAIRPRAA